MSRVLNIESLQPGMLVTRVIEQNGSVKVRKIGMIRSPEMVQGLKDMGVLTVEVDLSQSIGLEIEEREDEKTSLTPTQRLLKSEKVASRDAKATEQPYNRTMFVPSADQLPSRWVLYGRPSTIISLLLVGGLCVGWNLSQIPTWLTLMTPKEVVSIPAISSSRSTPIQNIDGSVKSIKTATESLTDERTKIIAATTDSGKSDKAALSVALPNVAASETIATDTSERGSVTLDTSIQSDLGDSDQQIRVLGYQPEDSQVGFSAEQVTAQNNASQNLSVEDSLQDSDTASPESAAAPAISPELLARFNAAIAELDSESERNKSDEKTQPFDDVPRVDQLSVALLTELPSMTFSAHMYASAPENRWVRVNGLRLVEGDFIAEELQLVNIEPQRVILSFKDEIFSMNALSDW